MTQVLSKESTNTEILSCCKAYEVDLVDVDHMDIILVYAMCIQSLNRT